ncbi:MAG TPA: hypothetical protein VMZ71_16915, partial [Gemmataceae bacterium]|nr:hypothetical protein [Gemmataceae bacterium]
MRCLVAFALLLAPALTLRAADIKLTQAGVEVTGISKDALAKLKAAKLDASEWARLFRVVVSEGTADEIAARPSVAGTFSVTETAIRFEAQFPLTPGVKYRAMFHPSKLPDGDPKAASAEADLFIPKPPPGPPVTVAAVYP